MAHSAYPGQEYQGYPQEMTHNRFQIQEPGYIFPHQNQAPRFPYQTQQYPGPPLHLPLNVQNVLETKYLLTRSGPLGTSSQATAAASFFARNNKVSQQVALQPLDRHPSESSEDGEQFKTNFRTVISKAPPALPHNLLRRLESNEVSGLGKVRVILKVASNGPFHEQNSSFFGLDKKKRQVTLLDPSVSRGEIGIEDRKVGVAAPKMFAFDGVYTSDDTQEEVSAAALSDIIAAVINGNDGCLFCFGHANLGKTFTMVGDDNSARTIGVIPTAIAWLYKAIKEQKQKTGARFSVRVSAVEISNQKEQLHDLLAKYASESDQSPGVYLRHLPASQGYALQNLSEVRASSVEKASYYLDAALSERSKDEKGRESHLLYTLYIYQYSVDRSGKGGVIGGRSRLHLIDFGGCERTRVPGGGITLSGLGNVILGIFNGQKHLPCRESKVTQVLRECLGSLTCHATMLAHVSPEPSHYSETLHTIQLASRVHRMRRKRMKTSSGGGSSSSDEHRRLSKLKSHDGKSTGSSDFTTSTDPSSSELSCDTVVYRGHSDGSGTDGESPPVFIPPLLSMNKTPATAKVLRGSSEELSRSRRRSGTKILTNGAISPAGRNSMSPLPNSLAQTGKQSLKIQPQTQSNSPRSPKHRMSSLPVIQESHNVPQVAKMPLNGRVPGYRQPTEYWIDAMRQAPSDQTTQGNEIWVDGKPQDSPQARAYGYMDDFKANMISHWVENQSNRDDAEPLYLTQFKQAESDSGSEKLTPLTKVQVHAVNTSTDLEQNTTDSVNQHDIKQLRKTAPPPPPRKTPPRTDKTEINNEVSHDVSLDGGLQTSLRGEVEGSESPEPLQEPNSLDDIFKQCEKLVHSLSKENTQSSPERISRSETGQIGKVENIDVEESDKCVSMIDNGCQVTEGDIDVALDSTFADPRCHPLRILSEENLTVVSTFVADVNDLESMDDEAECDPSNFSFFEVPDFTSCYNAPSNEYAENHYFETRLKELAKIANIPDNKIVMSDKQCSDITEHTLADTKGSIDTPAEGKSVSSEIFSDPRFCYGESKEVLSTFSHMDKSPVSDSIVGQGNEAVNVLKDTTLNLNEPMTPQKQFLLLSQSLRHPDGSSNPDLNLAIPANRSPGNGQSSSDQEDDFHFNLTTYADTMNGNHEQQANLPCNMESNISEVKPKKKESNNIASKLMRLFGSTRKKNQNKINERRSKSCDRELDETMPLYKEQIRKDFHSASSSPLKHRDKHKKDKSKTNKFSNKDKANKKAKEAPNMMDVSATPSTLSLAPTEWEYQMQEDEANGNNGARNCSNVQPSSNGYHSYEQRSLNDLHYTSQLGQNSYLQQRMVMHETLPRNQQGDRKSSGYDSLEGESSSLDSSQDYNEIMLNGNGKDTISSVYAVPSDQKDGMMQYDDVDILRMEIKRHPNILRRAY